MKRILILLIAISLLFISCNDKDCSKQIEKVRQEMIENCDKRIIESQENCNQIIREREKVLRAEILEWKQKYEDCINQSDPPEPPKLTVRNGKLYYGNGGKERIILCGVSRWEALWRATGEFDSCGGWGEYSLAWYENELITSGINYVRHAGIKNTQFLYDHCKRMRDAGIIVEITVFRAHAESKGILLRLEDMGELAKLGNVFFDCNNEYSGYEKGYKKSIEVAKYLKNQNCIISGGAWWNAEGKKQSDEFLKLGLVDIITHHRYWTEASFKEYIKYNIPVIQNEYFAYKSQMSLQQTKAIMKTTLDIGFAGCQYYGLRFPGIPDLGGYDPFDYKDILTFAGNLVSSKN